MSTGPAWRHPGLEDFASCDSSSKRAGSFPADASSAFPGHTLAGDQRHLPPGNSGPGGGGGSCSSPSTRAGQALTQPLPPAFSLPAIRISRVLFLRQKPRPSAHPLPPCISSGWAESHNRKWSSKKNQRKGSRSARSPLGGSDDHLRVSPHPSCRVPASQVSGHCRPCPLGTVPYFSTYDGQRVLHENQVSAPHQALLPQWLLYYQKEAETPR